MPRPGVLNPSARLPRSKAGFCGTEGSLLVHLAAIRSLMSYTVTFFYYFPDPESFNWTCGAYSVCRTIK